MDDSAFVDLLHALRRGVDQMDVRQVKRRQELIMEGRPLATIGVIRFQSCRRIRVINDLVGAPLFTDAFADLLHDPEAGVELFLHQFFR